MRLAHNAQELTGMVCGKEIFGEGEAREEGRLVTTTNKPLVLNTEASVAKMASSDKVQRFVILLIFSSFSS